MLLTCLQPGLTPVDENRAVAPSGVHRELSFNQRLQGVICSLEATLWRDWQTERGAGSPAGFPRAVPSLWAVVLLLLSLEPLKNEKNTQEPL